MRGHVVRLAIFDFDHTLGNLGRWVDWSSARDEVVAVYRDAGLEMSTLLKSARGSFSVFRAADAALSAQGCPPAEVRAVRHRAFDVLERFELGGAPRVELMPGAVQAIDWLSARDVRLAVASANGHAAVQAALAQLGLAERMTAVVGRSVDLCLKPEPDQLLRCLELAECPADRAVAVGDSPEDAMAARACGIRAVGVLGGVGTSESLERAGAQRVIASLHCLAETLGDPPGSLLEA